MQNIQAKLMEYLAKIHWELWIQNGIRLLMIFVLAWVVQFILMWLLARVEKRLIAKYTEAEDQPPSETAKRIQTLTRLIKSGIYVGLWSSTLLIMLQQIGVEIGPLLAGAGILGLAVGFGAQNLVRDVISGFFIILENQVRVGDVAIINGTGGLVEQINFRTLVLRDLKGIVHVFPNGTITTLSNMTNEWSAYVFEIGVAYKENTDKVVEIIKEVATKLREDPEIGLLILEDAEVFGVDQLANSSVVIKGRIKTKPIRQWTVGREFLRRIKLAFDEKDIEIPFPHQTLYFGEASKPIDILMQKAEST